MGLGLSTAGVALARHAGVAQARHYTGWGVNINGLRIRSGPGDGYPARGLLYMRDRFDVYGAIGYNGRAFFFDPYGPDIQYVIPFPNWLYGRASNGTWGWVYYGYIAGAVTLSRPRTA